MNVVDINKYMRKREKHKMCQRVVDEIIQNRKENKKYLTSDMESIVQKILIETGNENTIVVPVVNIAKQMKFDTFQKRLRLWFLSGFIGISRFYKRKYGTDHVICTNAKVHPYQQRFVIAHELAHFLFDYNHKNGLYFNTYRKNHHNKESERRANAFAANLLMPREVFVREYNKAKLINSDPVYLVMYLSDLFKSPRKAVLKRIHEVRS